MVIWESMDMLLGIGAGLNQDDCVVSIVRMNTSPPSCSNLEMCLRLSHAVGLSLTFWNNHLAGKLLAARKTHHKDVLIVSDNRQR
jgi:hypothetical protein